MVVTSHLALDLNCKSNLQYQFSEFLILKPNEAQLRPGHNLERQQL